MFATLVYRDRSGRWSAPVRFSDPDAVRRRQRRMQGSEAVDSPALGAVAAHEKPPSCQYRPISS